MAETTGTYTEPDPTIAAAFPYALADNDRNRMVFSAGWRTRDAEVGALRAQLDNMTKRHASALGAIARVRSVVMTTDGDYLDGADFDGLAGEVQQALGPWVEVSG